MTHIHVRELSSAAEWEQALALLSSVFVGEGYSQASNAERLFQRERLQGQGELLVFTSQDGTVRGVVLLLDPASDLRQVACGSGEDDFRLLAVTPSARGAGLGRLLVEECGRRAAARGAQRLVLATQPTMTRAQELYEGLGFSLDATRDWILPSGGARLVFVRDLVRGCVGVGSWELGPGRS